MNRLLAILLLTALCLPAAAADKPTFQWDHYFDQDAVADALRALSDAYPDLTELTSLGKSAEGRDIWQLTITNEKTGAHHTKPALYADGAIHGNEIQATEVCLYTAWLLCDRYGEWERVTELLDRAAFYIVPTVNVDSRARYFDDPGSHNIGRTAHMPRDDDHDGLIDEDFPEDLDGDGLILQMRVRDPHGTHRTDPDDPRTVIRIKPGEQAEWTLLGLEGIDSDGDGQVNEDGPGYLDMNRSYAFNWQPPYVQSGSGNFPLEPANTRAVAGFLRDHPNIGFGFAWHNTGGMFLRGPSSESSPPIDPADLEVYDWLGREGERTVPGYRYLVAYTDLYPTYGDFDEFCYQVFGFLAYTGELSMSSDYAYRGRSDESNGPDGNLWSRRPPLSEKQQFNDHLMAGEMFSEWKTFQHPQYGEIEIGGWKPWAVRTTPGWMLPDMLHRNAMFMVWTAMQLPEVSVEIVSVTNVEGDLWRVRARAVNTAGMPTLSANARNKHLVRRDLFTIEGADVLSGGVVRNPWLNTVETVAHRPERLETWTPAQGARDVEWIVRGGGKVTVRYDGARCGATEMEARLQ